MFFAEITTIYNLRMYALATRHAAVCRSSVWSVATQTGRYRSDQLISVVAGSLYTRNIDS